MRVKIWGEDVCMLYLSLYHWIELNRIKIGYMRKLRWRKTFYYKLFVINFIRTRGGIKRIKLSRVLNNSNYSRWMYSRIVNQIWYKLVFRDYYMKHGVIWHSYFIYAFKACNADNYYRVFFFTMFSIIFFIYLFTPSPKS